MREFMRRLIRQPVLHYFVLGALLGAALHRMNAESTTEDDRTIDNRREITDRYFADPPAQFDVMIEGEAIPGT